MPRILIADAVAADCTERLRGEPGFEVDARPGLPDGELRQALREAEALVVRSATRVTADLLEFAPRLRVIGRAGEGVDNIDVDAATERGIVVMNTPGGNTVSAAEHAFGLMMALARRIPEADRSMSDGKWERKRFVGVELLGKTLGVIGLGKIGREVALRARAFGMDVLAFDPFLPEDQARQLKVEPCELPLLMERSDFLTVHTPLTESTRHLIGAAELRRARPGLRLINCARGGIYDEAAVADAIREGRIAGAAFDVFELEPPRDSPLIGLPNVICTPHLGASTREAQEKVAVRIADQIIEFLRDGVPRHALNVETVDPALRPRLEPFRALAERLGRLGAGLHPGPAERLRVELHGDLLELPAAPLVAAVLTGYLREVLSEPVNQVNATALARRIGIAVTDVRSGEHADFANLITVGFQGPGGARSVSGTLFGRNRPRIVQLDDYWMEVEPAGEIFFYSNDDRPGIIGQVGTLLGDSGINIAQMTVGRDHSGGTALGVVNTDSRLPDDLARRIEQVQGVLWTRRVRL